MGSESRQFVCLSWNSLIWMAFLVWRFWDFLGRKLETLVERPSSIFDYLLIFGLAIQSSIWDKTDGPSLWCWSGDQKTTVPNTLILHIQPGIDLLAPGGLSSDISSWSETFAKGISYLPIGEERELKLWNAETVLVAVSTWHWFFWLWTFSANTQTKENNNKKDILQQNSL